MLDKLRPLLITISFLGLGLTIIPSILVLMGILDMNMNKNLMFLGTVLWFGSVIFWMNKEEDNPLD